ncbi:STP1 protein [Plasmodium ovale]|uniref:STP1 protein n=1 Tax=Plasmodium ovale TaxID=36330 RepID=A0A1C3KJ92_PLAOA|nr:STP1 protein [Plasmodium ovale]
MADHQGYTIYTRDIPIDVFLDFIQGDIKNLIRKYGHKNCGLMHEELCEEIKKIIFTKKKVILSHTDEHGQDKLNSEWSSKKKEFLNKLFEEEEFINMCYPPKEKGNANLQKLKSRHIQFCKEKDKRRSALGTNPEYNSCKGYNVWINNETTSFTLEFLQNVKKSNIQTVKKYFSTKEHPRGHDPLLTYRNSKLDCTKYNSPSRSHPQIPEANVPPNKLHPPVKPNIIRDSQGKDAKSVTYGESTSAKTKPDANILPNTKPSAVDSQLSSPPKTQPDGIPTGQDTLVKSKDSTSLVNVEGPKKETIPVHHQPLTPIPTNAQAEAPPKDSTLQPVVLLSPLPTEATSLSSSLSTVKDTISSQTPVTSSSLTITSDSSLKLGLPSPPDPPATEGQDNDSHSTQGTSSHAHAITNPTKSVPSTNPADSLLSQPQSPELNASPAVTTAKESGTPSSSSSSTFTTTVTSTTSTVVTVTIPSMSTIQNPISSPNQAPGILTIPQPPTETTPSKTKVTSPATDKDTVAKSAADALQEPDIPLSKNTVQATGHVSNTQPPITHNNLQSTTHHRDQQISPVAVQHSPKVGVLSSASDKSGDLVTAPKVNTKTPSMNDSTLRTNKNDNPSIIHEGITPLKHIIPTLLVILATITLLFQLYKYTPFGFLLGRRRKRNKQDLKRIFKTPQKPTYESPNITVHELEDPNLVGQIVENDAYTKLLKINRYKQEMQKRKKKNKKTLIEVHMEVLEEYKSDEWELHKGDFLEICLHGFINDENDFYSNFPNSKITINNINEKTIEDIQKQEILWNNWIEDHRNILEQWKKEDWFHILKNKWRNEEKKYKEKSNKLQENMLNEQETYSIVSQKDMWKQWISKQATLIDMFNKEEWFKSIVHEHDKEKDLYHINEYNDISVTSKIGLKNEKINHEYCRSKNIIHKLMVQIHMMVLEECIKEEIIKQKELCIDNFIENIHNQNNYDEKINIPQCDTDDFSVPQYEEIHTSKNK